MTPLRTLIVEDSEDDTDLLLRELRRGSYDPTHLRVETAETMIAALSGRTWDIVFSDFTMPQFNAFDALAQLQHSGQDIPFIVVSGTIGEDRAVAAMKAGAHDYILKGNLKRLLPAVERELRESRMRSERKQAEVALRLQSAALNAASNAIIITDRQGTIEWINPAFTALTGYSAEEAIGKNSWELVKSGVHDQVFFEELWDTIRDGNVWHGEITNRRRDGSLYIEEQSITPVKDARGETAHFIEITRDLTEEKRLESQFLQSQKMESVGRLAAGIAHDFNNLLNVINGTAVLASEGLKEGDSLQADLEEIRRAGERAASLTRQLLAFSRQQIMEPDVFDLNTLVADLGGMLRRVIGEDIEFVVVPAGAPCSVRADPGQIEQVVMNLVVNARDAMPTHGTLTIETQAIDLDEAHNASHPSVKPGSYARLMVSDSGVGMDEATRMRIFEPFFTTKEPGKGTGLGLSTVYGIVQQSGGSIGVNSELGRGTTFEIYLPRVEEVAHTERPARTLTPVSGTETILVVEDYLALGQFAKRILQSAGYTVLVASNGDEALLLLERHEGPVHLLLTDVVLPGMGGPELVARIADVRPQMKVIYASGHTDDALLRHGVAADATHFLVKPYTSEVLTRAVRAVLDAPPVRQ